VSTVVTDIPFAAALDLVHLTHWHATIPADVFRRAFEHSLSFAVRLPEAPPGWAHREVAYARIVTDHATYAYLCDVIVHPDHRGMGHARAMVNASLAHPELQTLRRYTLLSRDAPDLYRKLGFDELPGAITYLERRWERFGALTAP
jgi:ribosomal protein S18 acetylase RimI-like enzyme